MSHQVQWTPVFTNTLHRCVIAMTETVYYSDSDSDSDFCTSYHRVLALTLSQSHLPWVHALILILYNFFSKGQ